MNLFRLRDDNYTDQKFNGSALILVLFLACFAILPMVQAVVPAPDGGYPGGNTAEGQAALLSRTTGGFNTAVGFFSLRSDTTSSFNTAIGAGTLLANTGEENTAIGVGALLSNMVGAGNTATGALALSSNTTGGANTANGEDALFSNTIGSNNTAIGPLALGSNTTGSGNMAMGPEAGGNITTANNVICIGAGGVNVSNSCFIGNIRGVTTTTNDAIPVLIDSFQQLGTASSSRRYKTDIKRMDKASEAILALKPVSFRYKTHKDATPQFGLIAEQVAEVNPDLVIYDADGKPYTVRYDAVNAMLLNEFLKEHKTFVEEQRKVEKLQAMVATLVTTVKEQSAQIQKVSAQLKINKATPQMVNNR